MARPKSYDRDAALMRACQAFWQHGYAALGVRAIESQTGLNQFAIRSDFGGKEGLFLEALELYMRQAERSVLVPLQDGGIGEIDQFFEGLVTPGSINASRWGCLVVNSGLENASVNNARITAITRKYWQLLNDGFTAALQRSLKRDEVIRQLDVAQAAEALVIAVMGVHTMNRTKGSDSAGRPMVTMVQNLIAGWRR